MFPSNVTSDSAQSSHQTILSALQSDNAAAARNVLSPFKPVARSITNPPVLMSQLKGNSNIASARRPGAFSKLADIPSEPSSSTDLPALEPAHIRARTKTNVASFHLQSQLLESLATPFLDGAWTSVLTRVGSMASIPAALGTSTSSINLAGRGTAYGSTTALVHPLSSKFLSNQSVFTTSAEAPYSILTGNDMACLVFGMSKSEIRGLSVIDLVGPTYREELLDRISKLDATSPVFLCGEILPISKFNGQTGYSSFWAKRHSSGIIAWVIEEVVFDMATIQVDLETGVVSDIQGSDKKVLFPYLDMNESNIMIHDIVSGLPQDLAELTSSKLSSFVEQHVTISGKVVLPCSIVVTPGAKDQEKTDSEKLSIDLLSFPHMAGFIMIDVEKLTVEDYNKSFVENLFGYTASTDNCTGWSINELVPHFSEYLEVVKETYDYDLQTSSGIVLPEHLFRKLAAERSSKVKQEQESEKAAETDSTTKSSSTASLSDASIDSSAMFLKSRGIEGLHKDGHLITIDVQARIIGASYLALWVTYSRNITGVHEAKVPSQLSLLSIKKAQHAHMHPHGHRRSKTGDTSHGRNSSGSSTNSTSVASYGSMTGLTSNDDSSTKINELSRSVPSTSGTNVLKLATSLPNESASQPKTPTSPNDTKNKLDPQSAKQAQSTPKSQIFKVGDVAPNSASSQYSIHIPELGKRRREKTLSDFKILQRIGEGAYGKVLLAQYKEEPHLRVVLKCVIKERILVDTWTRDRKLGTIPSEIKVMAVLNKWPHDNIVQLLDFFEDDEFYHIEMEPHGNPGTDLFDLIELQPCMSESQCKSIFKQVVSAVRHLHGHDIVHRDIKDENIIVDGDGLVKLIDFGSSAFVRQGPFDLFVGTIDYAAPEVLSGRPYEGKPQDVWALGILLYTIVYKENPFYSVDEIMDHELRVPFVLSEDCLSLIKLILTRDLRKRPSVEDIWAHPWMEEDKEED